MAEAKARSSDLGPRLLTAAIGVPIILGIAFAAPIWAVWLLWGFGAAVGAWEWVSISLREKPGNLGIVAAACSFAMVSAIAWDPTPLTLFTVAAFSLLLSSLLAVWGAPIAESGIRLTASLSAFFYSSFLFGSLLVLSQWGESPMLRAADQAGWMLFPLFVIWSGDTGAYFAGRAFGKHKLAPQISPKKTWEGAIGGLAASMFGAFLASLVFENPPAPLHLIAFALPAAVLGQLGDLVESGLKRAFGVKDSGKIVYGHGGILDRMDALLFAAPWFVILRAALNL